MTRRSSRRAGARCLEHALMAALLGCVGRAGTSDARDARETVVEEATDAGDAGGSDRSDGGQTHATDGGAIDPQDAGSSDRGDGGTVHPDDAGIADGADAGSSDRKDAGAVDPTDGGAGADAGVDPFGVRKIYPALAGGREWYLPDDADLNADPVFVPSTKNVARVQSGHPTIYETAGGGSSREVRMDVHSPRGAAWWQNVETTAYFRAISYNDPAQSMDPHWELEVRGETHSTRARTFGQINDGVPAPPGTETWPWYPGTFTAGDAVVTPCLGTTYHANQYLAFSGSDGKNRTARIHFEKEIAHTDGYASTTRPAPGNTLPPGWSLSVNQWFGYKFVVRNLQSTGAVHLEFWLDRAANNAWEKVAEADDAGGWTSRTTTMGGCAGAPYGYAMDEILTWAGPWIGFRSDELTTQFQKLSVREIAPLP